MAIKGIKQPNGRYKYPLITEHHIQRQILDWLKLARVLHYRQNVGAQKIGARYIKFGEAGLPDIVCVVRGIYVGIEVKGPHGELSRSQVEFSNSLSKAGGRYFVVKSLDEAQLALKQVRGAQ